MTKPSAPAHQDELPLSSVRSHSVFPGRTSLYVHEVAAALSMSADQVIDLIEEYQLTGGKNGIEAINIGSGIKTTDANTKGSKSGRAYWRIPVSAYDAFIDARKASNSATPTLPKK